VWLHGIKQGVDADKRKGFSDTRNQYYITRLMRLILHLSDERHIVSHACHLIQNELLSFFLRISTQSRPGLCWEPWVRRFSLFRSDWAA
jgi:hypothetical protein